MRRKKNRSGRANDPYSRLAKKERFPARSVYKLKEMQAKFGLIKKKDRVLDLGCFPGSWLLYAAEAAGPRGRVVGVDLKPLSIQIPSNAEVLRSDILSMVDEKIKKKFNVVLSDAAPSTTGIKIVDAVRSYELCQAALSIARQTLVPGGSLACKIFVGEDFAVFNESVKKRFRSCKIFKPRSSRKASKEIYLIGSGYKSRRGENVGTQQMV